MKYLVFLAFAGVASAQWWNPFSWGSPPTTGTPTPPAVVNCTIQPRTFEPGSKPRVEESDWKACPSMLEADITALQLANVKDPADFLNARVKHQNAPTKAYWRNEVGAAKVSAMNPAHLSLRPQADAVRLKALELVRTFGDGRCPVVVVEHDPINAFSQPVYSGSDWKEERRHWYIAAGRDNLNVGLIRQAYASAPVEAVQGRFRAELEEACR